MNLLIAFLSSLLFALGLGISGMTDPKNIIGFLNIFGEWRPALMFVMLGAISIYGISYFIIMKRKTPVLEKKFFLPSKKHIDKNRVLGSILFGIGWGIAGYCPGPAIVSLATLSPHVIAFVLSMVLGIAFYHFIFKPYWLEEE